MAFTGGITYVLTKSPNAIIPVGSASAPAVSETFVDQDNYDNGNYRDEFLSQTVSTINATFIGSPAPNGLLLNNNVSADTPFLVKTTEVGVETPTSIPASTATADDKLLHVPPRNEEKKRTLIKYWTGAGGTGNQVGEVAFDKFVSWSGTMPTRF